MEHMLNLKKKYYCGHKNITFTLNLNLLMFFFNPLHKHIFISTLWDMKGKNTIFTRISAHPFRGCLGPQNRVHIRIDGALNAHAKSETTTSLSVGSL